MGWGHGFNVLAQCLVYSKLLPKSENLFSPNQTEFEERKKKKTHFVIKGKKGAGCTG